MKLQEIYENNPNLSFESAVRTVGSEELLLEVAVQFGESAEENIEALENFMYNKDYGNFTIRVHSLKSSAKMIGEERLARLAQDLENLGKKAESGDIESGKNLIRLMPETILRYLKAGLSFATLSPKNGEEEGREDLPEGYMDSFYGSAAVFVEDYDSEGLEGLFAKTDKYSISGADGERYRALKKACSDLDWDRMSELIGKRG